MRETADERTGPGRFAAAIAIAMLLGACARGSAARVPVRAPSPEPAARGGAVPAAHGDAWTVVLAHAAAPEADEPPPPAPPPADAPPAEPPPAAPPPADAPPAGAPPVVPAPPSPAPAAPPPPTLSADEWWSRALGLDRPSLACLPTAPVPRWSGDVTVRARGRYTDDDADTDLYQYLRLRHRREDAAGWSASLHVRVSEDLDGTDDGGSFFVFDSVDDGYDSAVLVRLYHLYANYHAEGGFLDFLRLGRQDVAAGELFHVDGVQAVFRPGGGPTRFRVFGGVPTHLYDESHEGDWIVGASASFVPWCGASVEISDVQVEDESGLYGSSGGNLATIEASQRVRSWGHLRGGYQQLDEDPRKAWGSLDVFLPRWDATLRGAVHTQILDEKEQAYDIDPYYAMLFDLEPYWQASVSASKGLGRGVSVEAGAQVRRLYDEQDEGDFNHDFSRFYATLSARASRTVTVAVTGEWWEADDGEDYGAAGFEVDWRPSDRFRWTAGMDYALYRTDLYAAEERFDSYGWFLRARHRSSRCWEWDGSVRLDTDDDDTYWTVQFAVRFEF